MRVWFRKILHCPSSVCFCKPAQHLYAPPPATSDLDSNVRIETAVVASDQFSAKKEEAEEEVVVVDGDDHGEKVDESENVLKSSIKRKVVSVEGKDGRKKTVQWMDVTGKSLVNVKEFETSDSEDTDSEGEHNRGCICAIL
ncbi:unnamed protein product [Rhodiola kirilowii]